MLGLKKNTEPGNDVRITLKVHSRAQPTAPIEIVHINS